MAYSTLVTTAKTPYGGGLATVFSIPRSGALATDVAFLFTTRAGTVVAGGSPASAGWTNLLGDAIDIAGGPSRSLWAGLLSGLPSAPSQDTFNWTNADTTGSLWVAVYRHIANTRTGGQGATGTGGQASCMSTGAGYGVAFDMIGWVVDNLPEAPGITDATGTLYGVDFSDQFQAAGRAPYNNAGGNPAMQSVIITLAGEWDFNVFLLAQNDAFGANAPAFLAVTGDFPRRGSRNNPTYPTVMAQDLSRSHFLKV